MIKLSWPYLCVIWHKDKASLTGRNGNPANSQDFLITLDFEYFSPGNFKLPFQGAKYMPLLTQGVALGWYKLAFQAGIALSGTDEIQENLIACMKATPCLTETDLCIKTSPRRVWLGQTEECFQFVSNLNLKNTF